MDDCRRGDDALRTRPLDPLAVLDALLDRLRLRLRCRLDALAGERERPDLARPGDFARPGDRDLALTMMRLLLVLSRM